MAVQYETNRWGDRVAISTDLPGGREAGKTVNRHIEVANSTESWHEEILDKMRNFDAFAEREQK